LDLDLECLEGFNGLECLEDFRTDDIDILLAFFLLDLGLETLLFF
jgi:hypothetical protein